MAACAAAGRNPTTAATASTAIRFWLFSIGLPRDPKSPPPLSIVAVPPPHVGPSGRGRPCLKVGRPQLARSNLLAQALALDFNAGLKRGLRCKSMTHGETEEEGPAWTRSPGPLVPNLLSKQFRI